MQAAELSGETQHRLLRLWGREGVAFGPAAHTGDDDPYSLGVVLVYPTHEDSNAARELAESAAVRIRKLFIRRCRQSSDDPDHPWKWIELESVQVASDQSLTPAQSENMQRWDADYISLNADPEQPILRD